MAFPWQGYEHRERGRQKLTLSPEFYAAQSVTEDLGIRNETEKLVGQACTCRTPRDYEDHTWMNEDCLPFMLLTTLSSMFLRILLSFSDKSSEIEDMPMGAI
jgi:hypothetical protein